MAQNRVAQAMAFFQSKGWSKAQAAGIVGNLQAESAFADDVINGSRRGDKGTAMGLAQWRGERLSRLQNFASGRGWDYREMAPQLEYVHHELMKYETSAAKALKQATTVDEATAAMIGYERPQGWTSGNPRGGHNWSGRLRFAMNAAGVTGGTAPVATRSVTPSAPPAGLTYDPHGQLGETSFAAVAPQVTTPVTTLAQQEDPLAAAGEVGFSQGIADAYAANNLAVAAYNNAGAPPIDYNFELNRDHLKLAEDAGVNSKNLETLAEARSADHVKWLTDRILEEQERDERLASLGWTGTALEIGASIMDPLVLIPGLGIGTKAVRATKAGAAAATGLARATTATTRLGAFAKNGMLAGAYGAAYEALLMQQRPVNGYDNVLMAAGGGFVLGGAIGSVFGKRAPEISRVGKELINQSQAGGVGAARAPALPTAVTEGAEDIFKAADALGVDAVMMDGKFMRIVRTFGGIMDTVAQLKSSNSPLVRAVGNLMGEDVLGNAKGETAFGATERAGNMYRRASTNFYRDYDPAFRDWLKTTGQNNLNPIKQWHARNEFSRLVTEYVRREGVDPHYRGDPAVGRAAAAWRRTAEDFLKHAQNPGAAEGKVFNSIRGFASLIPDNNYVPRLADGYKINSMISHFGEDKIARYIKEAIKDANPKIADDVAEKMGKGYIARLGNLGIGDDVQLRTMFDFTDPEDFKSILREERDIHGLKLSDDEIDSIGEAMRVETNKPDPTTGKRPDNTSANVDRGRRRALLNEDLKLGDFIKPDGEHFTIRDLFNDNIEEIMNRYTRDMSGHIAMAQLRIPNPLSPGEMLVDGITKPSEWKRLIEKIKGDHKVALNEGRHADVNAMKKAMKRDVDQLEWLRRQVLGLPEDADSKNYAELLRMARGYQFLRVMGQVGFAQIPEMFNIIAQTGMETSFKSIPSLRSLWRNAKTGQLDDELSNELEAIWGFGAERLRAASFSRFNEWASNSHSLQNNTAFRVADNSIRKGQQLLSDVSGMAPVNTFLHRWTMRAMMHKFTKLTAEAIEDSSGVGVGKFKVRRSSARMRMEAMGLSEDMLKRVDKQMKKHVLKDAKGAPQRLNLEKWTDAEARANFELAIDRFARRIIQENDPGQMAQWMSSPIAKMFLQFRNFMIGSWSKQFLFNARMADWTTFVQFSGAMLAGGATHITQTHLRALGMGDKRKEEYLEERLDMTSVAKAAFQRGGWTPMLSGVVDTAALFMTNDPVFDYRTTGQPTDLIFGNPTMDFLSKAEGTRKNSINDLVKGRFMGSQQSIREQTRLAAFSNTIPFLWFQQAIFNGLDLPEERQR